MKKILSILISIVLCATASAQSLDSLAQATLGSRIEAYFTALAPEPLPVQQSEADFMIELSSDSLIRQFTAQKIYEHYVSSPVMGAENVAIHVFDKWFRDGNLKMNSDLDFMNARIFVEFNRQSLIGEKAPELTMESNDGAIISLFGTSETAPYRVLYFYDTSCAKCKLESPLLADMLATEDFPIEFYAIYAGDNRESWDEYIRERLTVGESAAKITHLWDPELDSDFQRKYGVLQTPRMFLVNPDGIIEGRGLDTRALSLMLHRIFDIPELEYGSGESAELFEGIFEGEPSVEDVKRIADYIEESTEGNAVMFRQLTGDMLYWLSNKSGEAFKEGTGYLIENKILSRPEIWKTSDDSLKVIGLAEFMDGLLSLAEPGTKVAGIKVPAERMKGGRTKTGSFRLDKLRGERNIILFYTEGCANCAAEKAAALELSARDRKTRILMVNVDAILAEHPDLASRLFETFDLSTLPFLLETDKKALIQHRYISLVK